MFSRIKSFLLDNKTTKQTVAKNTIWLFIGTFGAKAIKASLVIYAARILGANGYGVFAYALSLAGLFTIFIDFGINAVITRESTRDLSSQNKYFATAFAVKIFMLLTVMAIIFLFAPLFIKQREVLALLPVVVFMVGLDGFRDLGASLARAWEKMEIEAVIQVFTNLMVVVAGFVALNYSATPKSLSVGYTIGIGLGTIAAFYPFRRYFKNFWQSFSKGLIKKMLLASWPFGMLGVMGAIMLNTDTIMIGWYRSLSDVGYYGAAQRIVMLLYILPGLITTSLFPSMARLIGDKEKFKNILERGLSLMSLIAVPLTVASIVLSKDIIYLLYGTQYLPAVNMFRIMNLTYLPLFLSGMFGNAVFSLNKEKKLIAYVLLGVFGNFLFNLLLIPFWGAEGAAMSTVINQTIITLYLIWVLKKEIPFKVLHQIKKVTAATIAMAILIIAFKILNLNLYLIVACGLIVYFLALYLLKERSLSEMVKLIRRSPVTMPIIPD
jgi:O-antigen/teichoic acid export membrane protein